MSGKLPEIYWYLFWIGFVVLAFRMAYLGGRSAHEMHMRALDILKLYAEKGAEPPPAMMDQLAAKVFAKQGSNEGAPAGLLPAFTSFLFMACLSWGIHAWLIGRGYPSWAEIATTACLAFFSIGAFGFLLASLISRRK